jgi:hypothetical protein
MSRETRMEDESHVSSILYDGEPIDYVVPRTAAGMSIISHSCAMHLRPILPRDRTAMPITSFALFAIVIVVLASTIKNAQQ